jgi:hypothetical protein
MHIRFYTLSSKYKKLTCPYTACISCVYVHAHTFLHIFKCIQALYLSIHGMYIIHTYTHFQTSRSDVSVHKGHTHNTHIRTFLHIFKHVEPMHKRYAYNTHIFTHFQTHKSDAPVHEGYVYDTHIHTHMCTCPYRVLGGIGMKPYAILRLPATETGNATNDPHLITRKLRVLCIHVYVYVYDT